jgi:hypothetical protein
MTTAKFNFKHFYFVVTIRRRVSKPKCEKLIVLLLLSNVSEDYRSILIESVALSHFQDYDLGS